MANIRKIIDIHKYPYYYIFLRIKHSYTYTFICIEIYRTFITMKLKNLIYPVFIIAIVAMTTFNACSTLSAVSTIKNIRVTTQPKEAPVYVNYRLWSDVTAFTNEAKAAGVDISHIKDSINSITVYPLARWLFGLYSPADEQVLITSQILNYPVTRRKVVYHELGHVLGLMHKDGGIMETAQSIQSIYLRYSVEENWNRDKAKLFSQIVELQTLNKKGGTSN